MPKLRKTDKHIEPLRESHKSNQLRIVVSEADEAERKKWFGLPPRKLEQKIWRPEELRL